MQRRFGIEFEFSGRSIRLSDMRQHLTTAVAEHDPAHRVMEMESFRLWTIKSEHCGMEITTPVFEANQETFDIIHNIIDHLRQIYQGTRTIRRDCGLHVHIDIQEFTLEQIRALCKIFHSFEGALLSLQPNSRQDNSYCIRLNQHNSDWISSFDPDDPQQRYHQDESFIYDHSSGLSFGRFSDRGTIEIRYAAGTIRGMKAVGWLRTLLMLVEISKYIDPETEMSPTENIDDLKDFIRENSTGCKWLERLKTRCCRWITIRHKQLHTSQEEQSSSNQSRQRRHRNN